MTRQVSVVQPRPNIVFTHNSTKSLLLRIQKSVPDQFTTGLAEWFETPVEGWRETLANGFRNGYAGYFAPTSPKGPSDLRLEIERADLQWVVVGQVLVAHVDYKARLVDRDGRSIASASGAAQSKVTCMNGSPVEPCVASSVESMYEELADKLLRPVERPTPKPAPAGEGSIQI